MNENPSAGSENILPFGRGVASGGAVGIGCVAPAVTLGAGPDVGTGSVRPGKMVICAGVAPGRVNMVTVGVGTDVV